MTDTDPDLHLPQQLPGLPGQPPTPRLLRSVNETCDILSISRDTVYRLIRLGELETVRIGHTTRIRDDSIRRVAQTGVESLSDPDPSPAPAGPRPLTHIPSAAG